MESAGSRAPRPAQEEDAAADEPMLGAAGPGSLGEAVGAEGNATNPAAELRGALAGASGLSALPSGERVLSGFAAEFGIAQAEIYVQADADARMLSVAAAAGLYTDVLVERAHAYLERLCRGFPGWRWELFSPLGRAAPQPESQPRLFPADPLGR